MMFRRHGMTIGALGRGARAEAQLSLGGRSILRLGRGWVVTRHLLNTNEQWGKGTSFAACGGLHRRFDHKFIALFHLAI